MPGLSSFGPSHTALYFLLFSMFMFEGSLCYNIFNPNNLCYVWQRLYSEIEIRSELYAVIIFNNFICQRLYFWSTGFNFILGGKTSLAEAVEVILERLILTYLILDILIFSFLHIKNYEKILVEMAFYGIFLYFE